MAFPTNPTNGQQANVNGVIYIYSTTLTAWTVLTNTGANVSANNIAATNNITATTISATGNLVVGNLLPSANGVYNLGSPTALWASVYVSANTIYLGGTTLSANANSLVVGGNTVVTANATGNSTTTGNMSVLRLAKQR
jgi:hypothetical protein